MKLRRSRQKARRTPSAAALRRNHMLWGALTLLVAAVACYLVFRGPLPGQSPREVRVMMRDAGAIRINGAIKVRVAGVDVGAVADVQPVDGQPRLTEVTLKLTDPDLVVRRDATVKLRPRLFLEGNFFFDLRPGTPGAGALGDGVLPPSSSSIAVAADEFLGTFDASTRGTLRGALRGIAGVFADDGADSYRRLVGVAPGALRSVATTSRALRGEHNGDLQALIRDAGNVLDTAGSRATSIRRAIFGGRRTFDAFADRQAELQGTLSELDRVATDAPADLRAVSAAVPATRSLLREAGPLVRRLPGTLDVANPALRRTVGVARSGDVQRFLRTVRPTARSFARSSDAIADSFGTLTPVARCLTRNIVPPLTDRIQDGKHTTGLPVHRELGSLATALASSGSSFDTNGNLLHVNLAIGDYLTSFGNGSRGGALSGLTEFPIQGSTPVKPDRAPPFRPDVSCETQERVSLATTAAPFRSAEKVRSDPKAIEDAAREALEKDRRATTARAAAGKDPVPSITTVVERLRELLAEKGTR
jgi:ABC-type transporter Mla subunit MlaD